MSNRLTDRMLVMAHRGAPMLAPENTIESFTKALEFKPDILELDVQFTRDGKVVVHHDATINRTSNAQGAVLDYTYDELARFSFNNKMPEYKGARLPLLEEVLLLAKAADVPVNVEFKTTDPAIVPACLEIAAKCGMTEQVFYSSMTHYPLVTVLDHAPGTMIAPAHSANLIKAWLYAENMGATAIHPKWTILKTFPEFVDECHARGIRVHVWTVDEEEPLEFLHAAGVDAVMSNRPDLARTVIDRLDGLQA